MRFLRWFLRRFFTAIFCVLAGWAWLVGSILLFGWLLEGLPIDLDELGWSQLLYLVAPATGLGACFAANYMEREYFPDGFVYLARVFGSGACLVSMVLMPSTVWLFWTMSPRAYSLFDLYYLSAPQAAAFLLSIAVLVWIWRGFPRRGPVLAVAVPACVLFLSWAGMTAYIRMDQSVPDVRDDLVVADYVPFSGSRKLARLDGRASFGFDASDRLPVLDGATAMYPVYAAFAEAVYPEGYYGLEAGSAVRCSRTDAAYRALIDGQADMIFAFAPSDDELAAAARAGVSLELVPIGKEAFVFFVNKSNPVDGISLDDLKDIYAGRITSWSSLIESGDRRSYAWAHPAGGSRGIEVVRRNENSGSETALRRMLGLDWNREDEAASVYEFPSMSMIVWHVESKAGQSALGYSFRYYVTDMLGAKKAKLLAIDDVYPSEAMIRSDVYPLTMPFYAVVRRDDRSGEVRALLDWITGPEGQALVELSGYVPMY